MSEVRSLDWQDLGDAFLAATSLKLEAEKLNLQANAFSAWRNEAILTSMFAGKVPEGSETFSKYLETHNLLTRAERKAAAEAREQQRKARQAQTRAVDAKLTAMWEANLQ